METLPPNSAWDTHMEKQTKTTTLALPLTWDSSHHQTIIIIIFRLRNPKPKPSFATIASWVGGRSNIDLKWKFPSWAHLHQHIEAGAWSNLAQDVVNGNF